MDGDPKNLKLVMLRYHAYFRDGL